MKLSDDLEKSYDDLIGRPTLILVAATLPYGYFKVRYIYLFAGIIEDSPGPASRLIF